MQWTRAHTPAKAFAAIGALFAVLLLALVTPARAQEDESPRAGKKDQLPTPVAMFGWSGSLPSGRWGPINVEISNVTGPIGGYVVLEFAQDDTQSALIRVPFAATPDAPARVQVVAAVPSTALSLRLSLVDEQGRTIRSLTYGLGSLLNLPHFFEPDSEALIVSIGRAGASDAMTQWSRALRGDSISRIGPGARRAGKQGEWSSFHAARCEVADMPLSWMAYDAVTALVLNADIVSDADPRAVQAIRDWVIAGGRLVVLATSPGDGWSAFFPPGDPLPVRVEPLRSAAIPAAIAAAKLELERQLRARSDEFRGGSAREEQIPPLADSAPARRIALTPAGERSAWRTDWPVEEPGAPTLLAQGPVGHGWITILGIDPARTSAVMSPRTAGAVWNAALSAIGEDLIVPPPDNPSWQWGGYAAPPMQAAIAAAINRVGDVPVIGDIIFVLIAVCVFLLAVMIGPLDYFLLRRLHLSHRSWVTALAWTVLAGAGAYTLPLAVRTEPTQFNRVAVLDAIAAATDPTTSLHPVGAAHYTAVSGIYTAQSGTAHFHDVPPSSWWRGVSQFSPWQSQRPGGKGVLPVLQSAVGGQAGSTRASPITAVPFSLWTFRTMLDQGQDQLPLHARIAERSGRREVTIAGLPEGAIVTSAALQTSRGWHALRHTRTPQPARSPQQRGPDAALFAVGTHEPGLWTGAFAAGPLKRAPSEWLFTSQVQTVSTHGELQQLPGSLARHATIQRYVSSGRWACVYLFVDAWPPAPRLAWDTRYSHARMLRVLIPVEPEPGPEPEPPEAPGPEDVQ